MRVLAARGRRHEARVPKAVAQDPCDVAGRSVGAAEPGSGAFLVEDNLLAGRELLPLGPGQSVQIGLPVRRDEQVAAGAKHPEELLHPAELQLLRQVGENREGVDEIERLAGIPKRRLQLVAAELREREAPPAPVDLLLAEVAAADRRALDAPPVTEHPSAAAAEVENGPEVLDLGALAPESIDDH